MTTKPIYQQILWPILILWLAFGLRLYQLDFQSIWWDEGHSIFVASHPVSEIPTLPAMDVHPPAYFSLLHMWMTITGSREFALRYLSVIFSLGTVALLWRFSAYLTHRCSPAPVIAALLAALSPMYIAYGQEVRSYAMITFLALASTFIFWRLLFPKSKKDTSQKHGILLFSYTILTAACLYTHYFTIFLLLFQNLVWLLWVLRAKFIYKQSKATVVKHIFHWGATQAGILLLFIPQLMLALRQVTGFTNPNLVPPSLSYFINRTWQAYTIGLTIDPIPAQWGMWGIIVVLVVSWAVVLITKLPRQLSLIPKFLFLLCWLLVPMIAYYVVLQRQPSFEPRYMMLVTPALFLLLALGLSQMVHSYSNRNTNSSTCKGVQNEFWTPLLHLHRMLFPFLLTISVIVFLIGIFNYYANNTYFKDDSAGVAAWLSSETTANDIVYIDVPHPFHYYAGQRNIPAPTRYLFVDIHTIAEVFNREASRKDRLFWVTWWGSDTDPRGVVPFLAEKAGQPAGQYDFKGYKVQWFDLSPTSEPTFSLPNLLNPTNAIFGDVLRLDGVAFGGVADSSTTPANEPVWATLHFTLLRDTDVNYKVSLRLRNKEGQIISQIDRDLLNDRHFRTSAWPLADPALNQAINVYTLPLPPETAPGLYQLEAVIYNANPPYPSEGVTSHENTDGVAAILGRITVVP